MQLCNLTLRLGGSPLHTVPKTGVTPAEILVLQHIHGSDAVIDIRPTKIDKHRRHEGEFERLAGLYDRAASASAPGDEAKGVMNTLFPGAMKKLPTTLKEIGLGHYLSPAAVEAAERADAIQSAQDAANIAKLEAIEPLRDEAAEAAEAVKVDVEYAGGDVFAGTPSPRTPA